MEKKTAFQLFSQGLYSAVLEQTWNTGPISTENVPWTIGALIFLGRTLEAENLYESSHIKINPEAQAACRFFLGIGWNRRSKYKKAKSFFLQNHKCCQEHPDCAASIKFYTFQGIAFYFFFLGEFYRSLRVSMKSQQAAIEAGNLWMRTLAGDLVANNMIFTGQIHEGLDIFSLTQDLAKKIHNQALQEATEISKLVYACEYGVEIAKNFPLLNQKYLEFGAADNFSRNNVGLELSRQYILRGDFSRAEKILEEITNPIFSAENRRQEVRLNLRWAELSYLRNDLSLAQHYLRAANRCLDLVDQTYEIQVLGLELKIHEELYGKIDAAKKQRLLDLSQRFSTSKNQNILSRKGWVPHAKKENNQDSIHQALKILSQDPFKNRSLILETGYLSWLLKFFSIPRGQPVILLGLEEKSLTLLSRAGIHHLPEALTNQNYKILKALEAGASSKEELVHQIWGYTYDPLRHDSLIYSAMSSLRKNFLEPGDFIQNSDNGYFLKARLIEMTKRIPSSAIGNNKQDSQVEVSAQPINPKWLSLGLNHRQIQILEFLQNNRFVDVKICLKLFSISEITASRDLSQLRSKKLLHQVGHGRATKYTLK